MAEVPLESPRMSLAEEHAFEQGFPFNQLKAEMEKAPETSFEMQLGDEDHPARKSVHLLQMTDSLALKLRDADPKSSALDEDIAKWVQEGEITSISLSGPVIMSREPPAVELAAPLVSSTAREDELRKEVESLRFQLDRSETARIELASLITSERILAETKTSELEKRIAELEQARALNDACTLSIDALSGRRDAKSLEATIGPDDLLKHCARLTRRLEQDTSSLVTPDAVQALQAGRIIANLSARLIASEQQIKDEKLVLKNLFISWLERGERNDALEVLARAFDFTEEDRRRLHNKKSWARTGAAAAKWSFGESLADFVRDETS